VPVTLAVNPVGADSVAQGVAPPTITWNSLDGPLAPALLTPRMRTKYVPAGTLKTASEVALLPVSKLAMSVSPADDPACTRYELGASPPTGADQFNVTTEPLTVAERFVGTPGALIGDPAAGRNRDVVWRADAHPPVPNVPMPPAFVKHDHETVTAELCGPGAPDAGTTWMPVEGAAGIRLSPPPHPEMERRVAQTRTADRVRINPPTSRTGSTAS
jgi:hypothetical protein